MSFAAPGHLLYVLWHDVLIHPLCALFWGIRLWVPASGHVGDRLHEWSTEHPRWLCRPARSGT